MSFGDNNKYNSNWRLVTLYIQKNWSFISPIFLYNSRILSIFVKPVLTKNMATPKKEFREFFLRNLRVTSGPKADQETNFPFQYLVNGIQRFNRFLKNDVPSEQVYKKLFESLTFKLNIEDTAKDTEQGLVRTSSDLDAFNRISASQVSSRTTIQPHQLSEIIENAITSFVFLGDITISSNQVTNLSGYSDENQFVVGMIVNNPNLPAGTLVTAITYGPLVLTLSESSPINGPGTGFTVIGIDTQDSIATRDGIYIRTYKRIISGTSRFRKVFNLKIASIYSLIINEFGQLSLKGDTDIPGPHMVYGTPKITNISTNTDREWIDRISDITITTIMNFGSPIIIPANGTVNVITHTVMGVAATVEPLIEIDYDMNFEDHTGAGFNFTIFQAIDNITSPIAFDKVVKNITNINGFISISGKVTVKNILVGKTIQIKVQNQSTTNAIRVEYTKQIKITN